MEAKKNISQEVTIEAIAELIQLSAERTEKRLGDKIDSSIGELAIMTQNNFLKMEERLGGVEGRLDGVEGKLASVEGRLANIEEGMKDIKADLNKKVDKFVHKDLEHRVEKLEKKYA